MPTPIEPESQLFVFLMWLVGVSITVLGTILGAFRKLAARITSNSDELHRRINKVREEYVKREDLSKDLDVMTRSFEKEIAHLTTTMNERHEDLKNDNRQILELLRNK